jgi:transposase
VAIGLAGGELVEEFEIDHSPEGFRHFFARIAGQEDRYGYPVSVAMEGYNGYARPLDRLVRLRDYRLYNINNVKLARFKEIFPAAAKTDRIDARKGLELFQLQDFLPAAKGVLQEVAPVSEENDLLKRLTRRRRRLVEERARVLNNMQADLQAVSPGLLAITGDAQNVWFLRLLTCTDSLEKLARLRRSTLLKIRSVGNRYADVIQSWQKKAHFSDEVAYVGEMIQEDAARILDLRDKISELDDRIAEVAGLSREAVIVSSIPGFGPTSTAELAGEVGTVERFDSESGLALYLGMASLDNSSGKKKGSKSSKMVNTRAKMAMMAAVDSHRKCVPESKRYYEKKRAQGKKHNQAVRALGRHLCRTIYKMLREGREYEVRT